MPDTPFSSVSPTLAPVQPQTGFRWQRRYRHLVWCGAGVAVAGSILDLGASALGFVGTGGMAPDFCLASNLVTMSYL